MKRSVSTQHNILLITLDHGLWEEDLQEKLWTGIKKVNKVYYESFDPTLFGENVKGFTEDKVLTLMQFTTSILAFVQVPELRNYYDIFALIHGNVKAKTFEIPRIAYIVFFLETLHNIHKLKKEIEEYQEQYKGDVCLFKQIMETADLQTEEEYHRNMDVLKKKENKPTSEEVERFYNVTQRTLFTFSNNYLKWFESFESKTFFNIEEYTKRLDRIIPSDDGEQIIKKYMHAVNYVVSMRDRMLFQLKLKKEFASPGNYIAMIGAAHLESLKKMFEEDETKWNITVLDYREFGINEQSEWEIEKFKRQEAFENLQQLVLFKSEPVKKIFSRISEPVNTILDLI